MENYNMEPFFQENNKLGINYFENNSFNGNYNEIQNEEDFFKYFKIKDNNYSDDSTYIGNSFQSHDSNFEEIIPKPEIPKINFLLNKKKKPGKKKIDDNQINNNRKSYIHSKKKFDNILTKIQVSYMNFLVDFINIIIELYGRKDLKFRYLDSKIKKNIKNDIRRKQKEGSIGDIIRNDISPKYKTLKIDNNIQTYDELVKSGLYDILNILDQKFLFFFENVYYNNKRKFNLKDFGLNDLEIELPENIKLFENLSIKNIEDGDYEEYKKKMKKCVKWHFLGGLEEDEIKKIIKL